MYNEPKPSKPSKPCEQCKKTFFSTPSTKKINSKILKELICTYLTEHYTCFLEELAIVEKRTERPDLTPTDFTAKDIINSKYWKRSIKERIDDKIFRNFDFTPKIPVNDNEDIEKFWEFEFTYIRITTNKDDTKILNFEINFD